MQFGALPAALHITRTRCLPSVFCTLRRSHAFCHAGLTRRLFNNGFSDISHHILDIATAFLVCQPYNILKTMLLCRWIGRARQLSAVWECNEWRQQPLL